MSAGFVAAEMRASIAVKQAMLEDAALLAQIEQAAQMLIAAYRAGGKVLVAGNGGSAADAQHIAAEFVGRFAHDRAALPASALTTDSSILTAVGNDYGFESVFSRQLQANARPGDVFLALSTSGNSPNILHALETARQLELTRIGLSGETGGRMAALCTYCVRVPSAETPRIQEAHITIGHILCGAVERALFGGD